MTRTPRLQILPPPAKPPLTVAEALRNIAAEAVERRRLRAAEAEKKATPDRCGAAPDQQDDTST